MAQSVYGGGPLPIWPALKAQPPSAQGLSCAAERQACSPEPAATAITAAVVAGGGSELCGEHHGVKVNPFWGFGRVVEVRKWGGGGNGARPEWRVKAAALQWFSGQGKGCLSISEGRGTQGWWCGCLGWSEASWRREP